MTAINAANERDPGEGAGLAYAALPGARGDLDLAVDPRTWDFIAPVLIVVEAGGRRQEVRTATARQNPA